MMMRKMLNRAQIKISTIALAVATSLLSVAPTWAQSNSSTIDSDLVRVTKTVPSEASLQQNYKVSLSVVGLKNCGTVVVNDEVPAGATLVDSMPKAAVAGSKLSWKFDTLDAGERKDITITLRADKEGELTGCTTFTAIPRCCVATFVGRPMLAITKSGPETALIGDVLTYNITVSNPGTAVAKDVKVTDTVPKGLGHRSGNSTLTFPVGDLAPKASKTIPVILTADARGRHCNKAMAEASNTKSVSDDACTLVQQRGLEITKQGPKEQFLGKTAKYSIVVKNTGDVDLKNVKVTDNAPVQTQLLAAQGGQIAGNAAVWVIDTLPAGKAAQLNVTLTTKVAGTHCNRVSVVTAEGLSDNAEACTLWRGYPALLLEVIDTVDPLLIGEATQYKIRVTNQGTANDTGITIVAKFPAEVSPTSASGATAGKVNGKVVSFAPYGTLAPKQAIEFTINAKADKVGDSRLKVELGSDLLKTPVTEEESTHVY